MRFVCLFFVGLGLCCFVTGCGPKIDCRKLGKKMHSCADEVYVASKTGAVSFLEKLTAAEGGLDPKTRSMLAALWKKEKHRLAMKFVAEIETRCRLHKGNYREAEKINACLKHTSCRRFARCFAKAATANQKAEN